MRVVDEGATMNEPAKQRQIAAWRKHQEAEYARSRNRICEVMGASPVFRAKYRGKCAQCGGTGVISQGNECVLIDGAASHFECAVQQHQRQQPCETCGSTGNNLQRGPRSDKRVCVQCAINEVI